MTAASRVSTLLISTSLSCLQFYPIAVLLKIVFPYDSSVSVPVGSALNQVQTDELIEGASCSLSLLLSFLHRRVESYLLAAVELY